MKRPKKIIIGIFFVLLTFPTSFIGLSTDQSNYTVGVNSGIRLIREISIAEGKKPNLIYFVDGVEKTYNP